MGRGGAATRTEGAGALRGVPCCAEQEDEGDYNTVMANLLRDQFGDVVARAAQNAGRTKVSLNTFQPQQRS